jgi:hypothetical protein
MLLYYHKHDPKMTWKLANPPPDNIEDRFMVFSESGNSIDDLAELRDLTRGTRFECSGFNWSGDWVVDRYIASGIKFWKDYADMRLAEVIAILEAPDA